MDNFSSGIIAQISYLEEKNAKVQKNSPWGHFGGILGTFLLFGIFSKFYIFLFFIN
jgi:hypothetical protein